MPGPLTPLVPPWIWPRVQELCLQLLAAPEGDREALLAREKSEDVVRWVRLLIAAEGAEFEPPNLLDEARRLRVGSVLAGRFELTSYIASGTFGPSGCRSSGVGASVMCFDAHSQAVFASQGRRPVSISYAITPRA